LVIKIETSQHFLQLGVDIDRPDPKTMRNRLAKQQLPVACQHDTFFAYRDVDYFTISQAIAISRVKSEHAQAAREFAEIDVDYERGMT
jgi:hypothetical protein